MPDNSEVLSAAENSLANQAIKRSKSYGGTGGAPYTLMSGNYIVSMILYKGTTYLLQGIGVTFDNGLTTLIGGTSSNSVVVDLAQDSVAKLYVAVQTGSGFGSGSGIGGIYIETVRGHTYTSLSNTPLTVPTGWLPVLSNADNDPLANVVLIGLTGNAGDAVDGLAFFYKDDLLSAHGMTGVVYSNLQASPSTPLNVATATLDNQTAQAQTMSVSFSRSVASTYTFSTTAGVSAGVATTVEAGIPLVAKGEVQVSATVTFEITIGVAKTVTDTFLYNANVAVPPNSTMQASAIASTYTISGSYTAYFSEVWVHAGAVTRSIGGSINGLSAYDVSVSYETLS